MRLSKKAFVIVVLIAILLIGAVILALYMIRLNDYRSQIQNMQFSNIDIASIPDGTYTGESDANLVYVKVEVVVLDGTIVSIDLLRHEHGRGDSAEQIIDDIIEQQTIDVDAISGATSSSKVIRKAIENALNGNRE